MKPLIVLLTVFAISLLATKIVLGNFNFKLSGRIAMSAMLIFTAVGHFVFVQGMTLMLPPFIPFKTMVIYLTGVIELLGAIGISIPNARILTGYLLIVFFILVLPANIYAAINQVDYQKANFNGHGITYLWFRIPLQFLFILWLYFSSIKTNCIT